MPIRLEGSCQCGAVRFSVDSHTPYPYQRCYCSICRKSSGGGGFAINLSADAATLQVTGKRAARFYHAVLADGSRSTAQRHHCGKCGSPLWLFSPEWADLVHPVASAVTTPLPVPPERVHMMVGSKASWVVPQIGANDQVFDGYPRESIEDWHRKRGLWLE